MSEMFDKLIQPLSEAVISVFETLAFSEVVDVSEISRLPDWVKSALCSHIEINSPVEIKLYFIMNKKNCESILEIISGNETNFNREESVEDLVLEITNSVAGAFAINLQTKNDIIKLGLPSVYKNLDYFSKNFNSEKVKSIRYRIEDYDIMCVMEEISDRAKSMDFNTDIIDTENEIEKTLKDSKILIVDDSRTGRLRLKKILKNYRCEIIEAKSGDEALEILSYEKPDLILLDVMMPGKDGFATCEIIKSHIEIDHIPVIFVTTMKDNEYKIKGFKLGAVDYITKPYYAEEVLARVHTQLKLVAALKTIKEYNQQLEYRLEERTKDLIKSEREAVFGQMVQGIVHNIRNPLTSIIGAANLLDGGLKIGTFNKDDITKLKMKIEIIERSSKNLNKMLNSLMQKSRSDHSEEFECFKINDLIEQELHFLQADHFFRHKVDKEIIFDGDSFPVYAVPSMISQVFQNLVRNALDAMFETENPELKIKTFKDHHFVTFSISDNGPGISAEDIDKIFDPFFTTKPKCKPENDDVPIGTGLGLYICSEMVKVNNGKITVNKNEKGGAVFSVSLPCIYKNESQ